MSEVVSRIPFDRSAGTYLKEWQPTQDEQNAYDDRMRRGLNPQTQDYVQNGELICFGVSEHLLEENKFQFTPKAMAEINILRSWFPKDDLSWITRPAYNSKFDYTNYSTRAQLRVLLGLLVIRELPLKNFYTRCILAYGWIIYFVIRGCGRGLRYQRPIVLYNHVWNHKALANHPDLNWWALTRILPKNPPQPDAHREWRTRQTPVFHQYHKNVYRYRYRRPRYVPWDGSMNQPVMPYMHDDGTDVNNGTFKRNCNSTPQLK